VAKGSWISPENWRALHPPEINRYEVTDMPPEFPNVDEDTLELDEAPDRSVTPRVTVPIRSASLFNYPNNIDQPLADHKKWLELNVVPVLKRDPTLTCKLFGSASNDKAGVAFNLALAGRRAQVVKKFLLGKGVREAQFTRVQGTMETSRPSTDPRDRNVNVSVESPVNTLFGIRVVGVTPKFPSGLPGEFFFRIHDSNNSAEAFFSYKPTLNTGPLQEVAPDLLPTRGDLLPVTEFVSVTDFDGAQVVLKHPFLPTGQPDILNVTMIKAGLFSTTFVIRLNGITMTGDRSDGKLVLVDGPNVSKVTIDPTRVASVRGPASAPAVAARPFARSA
jgi:hypothetical protein